MKIDTNFYDDREISIPLLLCVLFMFSVLMVASLMWQYFTYSHIEQERPKLSEKLDVMQGNLSKLRKNNKNLPDNAQLIHLKKRIQEYNGIFSYEGRSAVGVLNKIEAIMPAEVFLQSFIYRRNSGELQLIATSYDEDELTELLNKLERVDEFSNVLLKSQNKAKGGSKNLIEYEIRLLDTKRQKL